MTRFRASVAACGPYEIWTAPDVAMAIIPPLRQLRRLPVIVAHGWLPLTLEWRMQLCAYAAVFAAPLWLASPFLLHGELEVDVWVGDLPDHERHYGSC